MKARKIRDGIYWMGAIDWDRRLFDSLIPLPDGTSYNSYLVQGSEKTALIDTVDPEKADLMLSHLENVEQVDYFVINHVEQDHSGTLPIIMEYFPDAEILTSTKGKGMIIDHLAVPAERIRVVEDGDTVSLGDRDLHFIYTPWVHWPETMSTYVPQDKILFSCDFFGSHLATTDLFADGGQIVYEAAKRYYAEIMMPFRKTIRKNMEKLAPHEIELIAPSHGPVFGDAAFIMDAYRDWISEDTKNIVVLPYVSMHGSTEMMVQHLVNALAARGVTVYPFELTVTDIGKLAIELVDATTMIIGTPTVHLGPHPAVFSVAHLANCLKPKLKYAGVIGSYGWASKAAEKITELIPSLSVEVLDSVICRGLPGEAEFLALDGLAETIATNHAELLGLPPRQTHT